MHQGKWPVTLLLGEKEERTQHGGAVPSSTSHGFPFLPWASLSGKGVKSMEKLTVTSGFPRLWFLHTWQGRNQPGREDFQVLLKTGRILLQTSGTLSLGQMSICIRTPQMPFWFISPTVSETLVCPSLPFPLCLQTASMQD